MDYQYLLLVSALCILSAVFCESERCNDQQYWEPHKGCKSCSNVCGGSRSILQCNWHCPNWGNIQNDKIKVRENSPIKNNGTATAGVNAGTPVLSVVLPIVALLFLGAVIGAVIYKCKKSNLKPTKDARKGQTLHEEIPLDDINADETNEAETTSETKQAVIMVDEEENVEDVDCPLGDGHMSEANSAQSVYEFSKEVSGDPNRVEPDYNSTGFCVPDQGGRRHAQLILLRMDNTELPPFEEVNEAGREFEGARLLTRVSLHREPGVRQNQLFLHQESPPQLLEETSAVQPSMEDTTQKYYISAQSSGEPYMTERLNNLQQPVNQQRPLPDGIERYHHVNVNAIFAGANYQHFDQTSDNNDLPAT